MKNGSVIFLSVIIIILISFDNLYMAIAKSISRDNIEANISNNLLSGLIYNDNGNKTEIFRTLVDLSKLDEDTVLEIMDNKTARRVLTDIVNSIYDYNLTGDASYKYTGDDIIRMVDENIDIVMSEVSYNFTSSDRVEVMKYLYNNTDNVIDTIYSTNIGGYTRQ